MLHDYQGELNKQSSSTKYVLSGITKKLNIT